MKNYLKNALTGITIILFYFLFNKLLLTLLSYFNIKPSTFSELNQVIYLLSVTIFILLIIILVYLKEIKKDYNDFKKNINYYYNEYKKYWPIMIALMTLSSIFISFFTSELAQNEETIRETLSRSLPYFIYIIISCSITAPLTEELVFRKSIKKIIPKKYLFIIMSGLIFGAIHVLGQTSSLVDYLYILSYSMPGFVLAYTYEKSNNIFVPISIHSFHNTILLIIQIIIGGTLWIRKKRSYYTYHY